jgi:hypothetical protein
LDRTSTPDQGFSMADICVGDSVRLAGKLAYLKSADPMPMLRPPDLVDAEEVGQVLEIRALDLLAVRFRRGCFLIRRGDLVAVRNGTGEAAGGGDPQDPSA